MDLLWAQKFVVSRAFCCFLWDIFRRGSGFWRGLFVHFGGRQIRWIHNDGQFWRQKFNSDGQFCASHTQTDTQTHRHTDTLIFFYSIDPFEIEFLRRNCTNFSLITLGSGNSQLDFPLSHHGGAAVGYYQAHGHIVAATPYSILIITSMTMHHALGLGKFPRAVAK